METGVPEGRGRARRIRVLAFVGLVAALALSGCAGASEPGTTGPDATRPDAAARTSEAGEVTIEVTWKGASGGPVFEVTMDTHSVDLDRYDLRELAVLRNDQGRQVQPTGWNAPKGGHHREGTLEFPSKDGDGRPMIGADTREIELTIRDVAGVPERRFEWRT